MGPHRVLWRNAFGQEEWSEDETTRNSTHRKFQARFNRRSPIGPDRYLFVMVLFEFRSLHRIVVMARMREMRVRKSVVVMMAGVTRV